MSYWKLLLYTGNRHILALKTQCDNINNGCEWTGELSSLDDHLSHCGYTFVPCPNECRESGNVLRKDIEEHKEVCLKRLYKCPHCEEVGEYQKMSTEHLDVCPKKEVQCPNPGCDEEIQRCEISNHRQQCIFEIIPCKFASIGCKLEFLRKDLKEHETDCQQHLSLALDTVHEQKKTVAGMQSKIEELTVEVATLKQHKSPIPSVTNIQI